MTPIRQRSRVGSAALHAADREGGVFTSCFFGTVRDGKIVHGANDVNYLSLLTQIGAVEEDVMAKAMAAA